MLPHRDKRVEEIRDNRSVKVLFLERPSIGIVVQPVKNVQLVLSVIFLGDLIREGGGWGGGHHKRRRTVNESGDNGVNAVGSKKLFHKRL